MVITDWMMPDLSGIELCEHLVPGFETASHISSCLLGRSEKSEVVKGLQAGADEYLTKPFHPDELLARTEVGKKIVKLHREIETKNRLLEQLALTDDLVDYPIAVQLNSGAPDNSAVPLGMVSLFRPSWPTHPIQEHQ